MGSTKTCILDRCNPFRPAIRAWISSLRLSPAVFVAAKRARRTLRMGLVNSRFGAESRLVACSFGFQQGLTTTVFRQLEYV